MKLVGTTGHNAEWYRADTQLNRGDVIEILCIRMIVMDVTEMPVHQHLGRYLYLMQPIGEVTKASAS